MTVKIGINGFGRIGRLVFRSAIDNPKVEIRGINDPFLDVAYMAYLLKYDSVHGQFKGTIETGENFLIVNGKKVMVYASMEPAGIPWKDWS